MSKVDLLALPQILSLIRYLLYRLVLTFDWAKVTKPFIGLTVHPCYRSPKGGIPAAHHLSSCLLEWLFRRKNLNENASTVF